MQDADNRFEHIARIVKAHGLDGFVRLQLEADDAESLIEESRILYLQNSRGDLFPARIESIRVDTKRGARLFFVKFDQIADRTTAESFQDSAVWADRREPFHAPEEGDAGWADIIGFDVRDTTGVKAVVTGVLENPAHLLIEMEAEGVTFLVPWVDAYVTSIDPESRLVNCQNLAQLTDL